MKGVVAGGGWWGGSDGHMRPTPSLHNNSAGSCGYIPVLDIFSKNNLSLTAAKVKTSLALIRHGKYVSTKTFSLSAFIFYLDSSFCFL